MFFRGLPLGEMKTLVSFETNSLVGQVRQDSAAFPQWSWQYETGSVSSSIDVYNN